MNRLCVFCGANSGNDPAYGVMAAQLGRTLAERGIGLVYGGGRVGLMGMLADGALAAGGEVIGVIPKALRAREQAHHGLTEQRVVEEEIFEAWTWAQLGVHSKPCGLLDVAGFFKPLIGFLDEVVATGLLRPTTRAILTVATSPDELLAKFSAYEAPAVAKWVTPAET
jgi:predicted Rossmann-fold nucleotide-binding protein